MKAKKISVVSVFGLAALLCGCTTMPTTIFKADFQGDTIGSPPNPVPPGAYVEMHALLDLICVVSSCPFDLAREGWTINSKTGPTELLVDVSG